MQSGSEESPEEKLPAPKKRRLILKVIEDSQPESHTAVVSRTEKVIDLISVTSHTQAPLVESQKGKSPAPQKSPSTKGSRSRQPTPSRIPPRHRSLSPDTKVGSWLSITHKDYEKAVPEHTDSPPIPETIHSGTRSQSDLPPAVTSLESDMNPSNQPFGHSGPNFIPIQPIHPPTGPTQSVPVQASGVNFTPIQSIYHPTVPTRSVSSQGRSESPSLSVAGARPNLARRLSGSSIKYLTLISGQSRRQSSAGSHQSFSSAIALREQLQKAQNPAAYEQIRSLALYPKKTPSLASSATGSSIISGGTSISSISAADLSNLKLVRLGEREKILAVSGSELQSRMTKGVLVNKQAQIQEFCLNPTNASDELTTTMKDLMATCSEIATHPYLIITPPLANAELPERREAEYLVASSGKFVALGKILHSLQNEKEVKVGIVVQNTKGVDLLEGFLRGNGIKVKRSDGAGVREHQQVESRTGANVTLVLGGRAGARAILVFPC